LSSNSINLDVFSAELYLCLAGHTFMIVASMALILARVFGNSAEFWLNLQRRNDLWKVLHSPSEMKRIERARPLGT
jgi:addiction module HigA family antidote